MKCQGKTLQGKKCKNKVSGRRKYCHHHSRSYSQRGMSASEYSFCGKKHYSVGKKKSRKRMGKSSCKKKLAGKIRVNLDEYKKGMWKSRKQAVAVSYSQVKKKHPSCKKYF